MSYMTDRIVLRYIWQCFVLLLIGVFQNVGHIQAGLLRELKMMPTVPDNEAALAALHTFQRVTSVLSWLLHLLVDQVDPL